MTSPETALIRKILARHGSRPDLRLWRNATAKAYVGKVRGRSRDGKSLHIWGGQTIQAGLCIGSSDLVGIRRIEIVSRHEVPDEDMIGEGILHLPGEDLVVAGQFIALEVKTENTPLEEHQERWLDVIRELGGVAAVVKSVEDVDEVLGEPPEGA